MSGFEFGFLTGIVVGAYIAVLVLSLIHISRIEEQKEEVDAK
jgi:multisubunit Na+/H+ antiporter MnhC subunit